MLQLFAWWFKLKGWTVKSDLPAGVKKCVIIAAPHTSNWDFVYSMAGLTLMNIEANFLAKKELFKWPLKSLLVNAGGIAIERSKKSNTVDSIIDLLNQKEELFLMLSPEGTRKRVEKWKSGFYHVALGAGVPVMLAFLDYKNKVAGTGPIIYLSGDKQKDAQVIRSFYETKNGKFPELFNPDAIKFD